MGKDVDKNGRIVSKRWPERRRQTVLPDKVLSGGGLNFIGVRAIKRDRKT